MSEFDEVYRSVSTYVEEVEKNGISQHSLAWFEAKKYTIGGSQIATLIGKNPYETPYSLLMHKLETKEFKTNCTVQWGSLFEHLLRLHTENTLACKILGANLFIVGQFPGVSYSPDGLGVVMTDIIRKLAINPGKLSDYTTKIWAPVLFEFKCLYTRQPKGKPPVYYRPQVKYGLEIIDILDFGIFIEGVFRKCAMGDLNFDLKFDKQISANSFSDKVIAIGYIYFKTRPVDVTLERAAALRHFAECVKMLPEVPKCIDLGEAPQQLFESALSLWHHGVFEAVYGEICYTGKPEINLQNVVAVLPWKLFRVDYHIIRRKFGFLEKCLPQINEFMATVTEARDETNPGRKSTIIHEYAKKYVGGIDY